MSHSHIPVIVLVTDFYNSLFDAQDLSTFTAVLDTSVNRSVPMPCHLAGLQTESAGLR